MEVEATPTLFSNWIDFCENHYIKKGGVAPLVGSRREKLVSHRFGTPRIGSLGGKPNPLEVAVPVRIFNDLYSNPHAILFSNKLKTHNSF